MSFFRVSRRANLDRHYILSAFGFGLFVHRIHHDETLDVFHSHPWDGFSIILGSYTEEKLGQPPRIRRLFNVLRAPVHHRVVLHAGPVWSVGATTDGRSSAATARCWTWPHGKALGILVGHRMNRRRRSRSPRSTTRGSRMRPRIKRWCKKAGLSDVECLA